MFRYYILLFVSLFLCEKVVSTSVCSDISSTAVKNEAALISSTLLASATFISEYLDEGLPDYFSSSIGTNLTHREQARAHLMSLILDKDSYFGDNMQLMSVNFIAKNSVWMGYTRFYSPASSPNEIRYIGRWTAAHA